MATTTLTREITINLRARAAQRDIIDRAARIQGKNRTDFMLEAACEKAEHVLVDKVFFALDSRQFRRFGELLDASARKTSGIARLRSAKSPWTR